jgi:hypothetical protein
VRLEETALKAHRHGAGIRIPAGVNDRYVVGAFKGQRGNAGWTCGFCEVVLVGAGSVMPAFHAGPKKVHGAPCFGLPVIETIA